MRRHEALLAGKWVAQQARRADRARADAPGWQDNLSPEVPIRQPMQRELAIPEFHAVAKERDVLAAVLVALRLHDKVQWVERMNVGRFKLAGADGKYQWVRFGFKGLADIIGQLTAAHGGRFLAVECKKPGEQPTADQAAFLANVNTGGGLAFVATSVDDVMWELGR